MKYLVTGGAGFIGSNIVKALLDRGEFVIVLDNFSTGKKENLLLVKNHRNFKLIEGDIRNINIVKDAIKGTDYVLHQAALPSVPRSITDPITSNEVNVTGTLNVLQAAREFEVKRLVFASSSSIYGDSETLPKIEVMPISPLSPYALSKYAGERYCQLFYQLYGLETVCLRYFNVFGPNQDPSSQYSAVIPKFIKMMLENKPPVIYGDGYQSRDFTFISNNVEANILACTAKGVAGEVFNIACGEKYSLMELVNAINQIIKKDIKPILSDERIGDIKHSLADINKAKLLLNFKVINTFQEGLEQTIRHLKNNSLIYG